MKTKVVLNLVVLLHVFVYWLVCQFLVHESFACLTFHLKREKKKQKLSVFIVERVSINIDRFQSKWNVQVK